MRKLLALTLIVFFATFLGCKEKSPEEKGKEALKAAAEKVPDAPDKVVTEAAKAVKEGNLVLLYAMLPASYQKDVQDVVKSVGANMDKDVYEKAFALLPKAVEALKGNEQFKPFVPAAEGALKIFKGAKLDTHAGLAAMDVAAFLGEHGKAITDLGWQIAEIAGEKDAKAKLEVTAKLKGEAGEKEATVEVTADGKTEEVKFVKIEGKWIPEDMSKEWKEGIEQAKKGVTEGLKGMMEQKEAIVQQIDAVGKALDEGKTDQIQQMMGAMF